MVEISYVKRDTTSFCKKGCCVAYEDRGKAFGRRDLRLADVLSDPGEPAAAAPSISLQETNQSGCRAARLHRNPAVLRDLEDGDRPSEYAGDSNFDG